MSGFYKPNTELFTKEYWNRPPNKNYGDQSADTTYRAVGGALTNFERVEEAVADLFIEVTEADRLSNNPVRRAFGAIASSGVRRQALLAAAEAYFGPLWDDKEIRLAFFKPIEAVGFASRRRDDIAHGNVHQMNNIGAFLLPANYNTERTKAFTYADESDPLYFTYSNFRYVAADIDDFASKFVKLRDAIIYLKGFIRKLDDDSILFVRAVKNDPVLKI